MIDKIIINYPIRLLICFVFKLLLLSRMLIRFSLSPSNSVNDNIIIFGRKTVGWIVLGWSWINNFYYQSVGNFLPLPETKIRKPFRVRSTMQINSIRWCVSSIVSSPSSLVIFPAGESDDCATLSLADRKSSTTLFLCGPTDRLTHNTSWDFFPLFHLSD